MASRSASAPGEDDHCGGMSGSGGPPAGPPAAEPEGA